MVAAFLSGARGVTVLKPWPEVAKRLVAWLDERQLLTSSAPTCGAWGGCTQPVGHNQGSADIPENHGPFWQGVAEYWEREHQNTVLPYTTKLEEDRDRAEAVARSALHTLKLAAAERDAAQAKLDQIRAIGEEAPEPRGALRRRILAVLNDDSPIPEAS